VRADSYCLRSEHARWESRISKADLNSALLKAGVQVSPDWQSLQVDLRNHSGRVQLLDIIGKDGKLAMKLSASTLRFAVGRALGWNQIKSDLYDLKDNGDDLLFSGRGSGHGVGLCQEAQTQWDSTARTIARSSPSISQGRRWESLLKD